MSFIDQLSVWRENNRLEFKSARGGLPRSLWETYSAFANTNGGLIVLGVDETSEGPKVTGVADAAALVQDLWNGLNNQQKVSANLLLDSDIIIQQVDGAEIVAVKVPRADRTQRPVYINNNMSAGAYRRNGEGDYHCTMEVVRAMVRDSYDGALDRDVLDEIDVDALNADSVRRYRNEFSANRRNHPWIDLVDEEFLLRLGAIGRSDRDGELHPTKAGLIMFGEAWRIVDAFPNYFLDCRLISGERRWDDRITSDSGDWSGNVYDFWGKAYRMLSDGLPRPFKLGPDMARIDDTPQHKAVREGLTNALVHADYCGRTGVVVIRRRSAVEFSNPGCLRIPVEVVEGGGVSDPRNKTLMTMFNLIGRGDKAGSGFDVFRDAAAYAGVAEPELVEYLEPDRTKLMLCVEVDGSKLVDDDNVLFGGDDVVSSDVEVVSDSGNGGIDVGITDNNGGLNDSNGGINDADGGLIGGITNNAGGITRNGSDVEAEERPAVAEEVVLQIVQKNPNFTVSQMAAALGTSKRSMERLVSSLKSQGRLVRVGAKRNGHWEVRG
ncbi:MULTISPECIES: RNA-binding domain-containing protein [Collinsella]|uniref:RNA-binding domain-containing protein n=1 Tax=Collinsella TaxID=102106 RepID=UPI000B3AD6BD|nr:RNA-binding domain-containing protein [Collinsella sp. An268]MBM6942108.1 putative DNA binding domain-containing protein [Collinsella intestinalis]OUO64493.1 hypothetical protein B5F70_04465 [Collinsella sp. An268]